MAKIIFMLFCISMKITAINNVFISPKSYLNKTSQFYLDRDTVSFSGKININQEMKNLPSEAFPSVGLQNYMLQALDDNSDDDVVELHRKYYSDLLTCETLEEAKERYPEFDNVLDAKNLDLSKKPPNNIFCQITKGNVKGFDIDSVSLMILKKYYGELIPLDPDYVKENVGVTYPSFKTMLSTLNLEMDKRYFKLLALKMRSSKMTKAWESTEMREKIAESHSKSLATPEHRAKLSKASRLKWENPEYRANMTEIIRNSRRSPEKRAQAAEITKGLWQGSQYQKMMQINTAAAAIAWDMHPYGKEAYKQIAHEFPELKAALECKRNGLPMTDRQAKIISLYYKTCAEKYPNLKKEVGEIQKQLLQQWGFYEQDRNLDLILEHIKSIKD